MPRNGNGVYTPPANSFNPAVTGATIESSAWNAILPDLSAALTQSVSNDGQTPMVGALQMGNNRITGLADGSLATDAATVGQINSLSGAYAVLSGGNTFTGAQIFTGSIAFSGPVGISSTASVKTLTVGSTTTETLNVASTAIAKNLRVASIASTTVLVAGNASGSVTSGINASAIFINGQALTSTGGLIRRTIYTASANWPKQSDMAFIIVTVVAGGAGGGGAKTASAGAAASGGGGGGWSQKKIAAGSLGATEIVTVGAAGPGGAGATPADGTDGGNSAFGAHATANGGTKGLKGVSTGFAFGNASTVSGGTGGAAASGDINRNGQAGGMGWAQGINATAILEQSGRGGDSGLGSGGAGSAQNGATGAGIDGGNGTGYGAGGGGASSYGGGNSGDGGTGTPGVVIVDEYS